MLDKNKWEILSKPPKRLRLHGGVIPQGDRLILDWDEITPGMRKHLLERCCYCGMLLKRNNKCGNEFCKSNRGMRR